jgi:ribose transport system ATP-binding protein
MPLLEAIALRKEFPGVVALANGTLRVEPGEVHALVGENGAGKSTLMKLLSGYHAPDGGELRWEGRPLTLAGPRDARGLGIATIYQEFSLVPDLSIAENLFLGDEPTRFGLPAFAQMRTEAKALVGRLGLDLDPATFVRELSVAEQQLVEIARALRQKARLLSMDEPTAALSDREAKRLFELVRQLQADGVSILYVSHRMAEIFSLCSRATVLRDGATVAEVSLAGLTEDALVKLMVGREVQSLFPTGERHPGAPRLSVRNLSRAGRFAQVGFEVRAGEIVGVAGLVGAGRTEVLRGIFGADPVDEGEVLVDGQPVARGNPAASVEAGLGLLTEDRKQQGLALIRPILENASLAALPRFSPAGVLAPEAEAQAVTKSFESLKVRASGPFAEAGALSGGNQQKVLLSRWLLKGCKVLLFDEPTRGIDVGARAEIYEQIHQLAAQGLAVVVVSSDLPEVIGLCDRVLVMSEGRLTGELPRQAATEQAILQLAMPRGVARA